MSQLNWESAKYFILSGNSVLNKQKISGKFQFSFCFKSHFLRIMMAKFLLISVVSCDNLQDHVIPYEPFSFTVNLNIANELAVPGNSVFFPSAGFGGVIIYCELPGSYYAFDAACTHEASRTCILESESVLATCPCCDSQFVLLSAAYPSKGPATVPLRPYNISVVNDFTLRVYN